MKKLTAIMFIAVICSSIVVPAAVSAQDEKPFQIALVNPVQARAEDEAILFLRVNVIYGKNTNFKGIDLGMGNHTTEGESVGYQWGLVGLNEADFTGWQNNWGANICRGRMEGLQTAFYNEAATGRAWQLGLFNKGGDMSGFQLGLVNYCEQFYGLQIGLLNIITSKTEYPILPIVNWSF